MMGKVFLVLFFVAGVAVQLLGLLVIGTAPVAAISVEEFLLLWLVPGALLGVVGAWVEYAALRI